MLSESWATLWEELAESQPDHVAVVVGDTHIKWSELNHRSSRLAGALTSAGVGEGDKVGQLLYNCPEYLESAFAAFKVRASTVNVNYRYKAAEIAHVLSDSQATTLVYHSATPTAMQSSIWACERAATSTSSGYTFSPPVLIHTEPRPSKCTVPSVSILA